MPLAILLLGKILEPSFSLNRQILQWIFVSMTVFICVYLYQFLITWRRYRTLKSNIAQIEQEIFAIENPNYMSTKDKPRKTSQISATME